MQTPEEINRDTEETINQQNETAIQQERTNLQTVISDLQTVISDLLVSLHEIAESLSAFRMKLAVVKAYTDNWCVKHPEFSKKSSFSPSNIFIASVIITLIYIAAYWLDVLLLSHNAKLLVKDFADSNQTLIYVAILGIPAVILLMETYFQTQWAVAEDKNQKILWGSLSVLMCIAIPVAIVGFSMATTSAKPNTRAEDVQNWQLIGKAFLAFFAHAGILLGGKKLHEAKSYLIYKSNSKLLQWKNKRLTRQISRAEVNLSNEFIRYYRQLNEFNSVYPDRQIVPGPFNQVTRKEISQVFGKDMIEDEEADNPPAGEEIDDPNNGGTPQNPAPAPPNVENQDNQANGNPFIFNMDNEDEVLP